MECCPAPYLHTFSLPSRNSEREPSTKTMFIGSGQSIEWAAARNWDGPALPHPQVQSNVWKKKLTPLYFAAFAVGAAAREGYEQADTQPSRVEATTATEKPKNCPCSKHMAHTPSYTYLSHAELLAISPTSDAFAPLLPRSMTECHEMEDAIPATPTREARLGKFQSENAKGLDHTLSAGKHSTVGQFFFFSCQKDCSDKPSSKTTPLILLSVCLRAILTSPWACLEAPGTVKKTHKFLTFW